MLDDIARILESCGAAMMRWLATACGWWGMPLGETEVALLLALLIAVLTVTAMEAATRAIALLAARVPVEWIPPLLRLAPPRVLIATAGASLALSPFLPRTGGTGQRDEAQDAIPLAWMAAAIVIAAGGRWAYAAVRDAGAVIIQRARTSEAMLDLMLLEVGTRLAMGFVILGTAYAAVAILVGDQRLGGIATRILAFLVIGLLTWTLVNAVHLADRYLSHRFRIDEPDNLRARRIATQVVVLKRLAYVMITILATAMSLMQFEAIRHVGTSLLASAGIVGVIVGFAAQRPLANILAGMQIALTQPLRIDDAVQIEGEFGRVEEITLTYVVVALWDQRRLIVPLSRIIDAPFQNWTRISSQLLGTITFRCRYDLAVTEFRAEALRLLTRHPLWDRRAAAVQVTECGEQTFELRVLMSAAGASPLFDLRCDIREQLIAWLKRSHPGALAGMADPEPGLAAAAAGAGQRVQ